MASDLRNASLEDLQLELRRRERSVRTLVRKRERLLAQLAELDEEITSAGVAVSQLGGITSGTKRARGSNSVNLSDALVAVLRDRTLSVTEAAEAVQKSGYQTKSPNFRTIVNQTLTKDKRIKRVARGQYTAMANAAVSTRKKRGRKPRAS